MAGSVNHQCLVKDPGLYSDSEVNYRCGGAAGSSTRFGWKSLEAQSAVVTFNSSTR